MRKIKFRAWTRFSGRFEGNKWSMVRPEDISNEFTLDAFNYENGKLVKFMQFTGIKDKNEVEIYEGDILINECSIKQPGHLLTSKIVGDVQIINGMTYLVGKSWQYTDKEDMELNISEHKCLLLSPKLFQIIGNIFENPEIRDNN